MELNNIRNRNFLYEGQVLALARSARAAPPVEAEVPVEVVASAPVPEPAADSGSRRAGLRARGRRDRSGAGAGHAGRRVRRSGRLLGQRRRHGAGAGGRDARPLRRMARRPRQRPAPPEQDVVRDAGRRRPQGEAVVRQGHARISSKRGAWSITASCRKRSSRSSASRTPPRTWSSAGESIWVLAQQRYNIPIWLLRQYNPDLDLGDIRPGTKLVIPIVEPTARRGADAGMKRRLARARCSSLRAAAA